MHDHTPVTDDALAFRIVEMRRIHGHGRRAASAKIETPVGLLWLDYVTSAPGSDAFVAPASIDRKRTWVISRAFSAAVKPLFERFLRGELSVDADDYSPAIGRLGFEPACQ